MSNISVNISHDGMVHVQGGTCSREDFMRVFEFGADQCKAWEPPPTPSILRPGDVLSYAIQAVTGKPAATCGPCAAHVREMNQRGWLWCMRNRETVAEWLVEGAKRRGHTIDKGGALELLAVAVKELKQRRRGDGANT